MDSIWSDLGELPLPAIVGFGLVLGATILSVKPGTVLFLRAVRGFVIGIVFGGMGTVIVYWSVVQAGYLPDKLGFLIVGFVAAYLSQEIRSIFDAIRKYITRYRGRIARQLVIHVLEFILNKIKP
jgi:hypothetical protein